MQRWKRLDGEEPTVPADWTERLDGNWRGTNGGRGGRALAGVCIMERLGIGTTELGLDVRDSHFESLTALQQLKKNTKADIQMCRSHKI
ncbi:hypothetical protein E3N88_01302 [Mikania micrantha]|uniref:Uncharacterized protein n=1 Tax=Mikania micrantha TaxID=192012 RepID=A0A5N6Q281_9ASTR|nr:hypothetical protein E3N88_01302 [Mikania micrantha]